MLIFLFFFFNDTATTEIYTLSLHDALPILREREADPALTEERVVLRVLGQERQRLVGAGVERSHDDRPALQRGGRSEEHTSELQSRQYLVCRLLLEKKKKNKI